MIVKKGSSQNMNFMKLKARFLVKHLNRIVKHLFLYVLFSSSKLGLKKTQYELIMIDKGSAKIVNIMTLLC